MIQYLSGINVVGNIDLNSNELKKVVIDNLATDPTGAEGRIYFNTVTDKLKLYANGAWVDFQTGADGDTTYDLSGVGSSNGTAGVRLSGSDSTTDDVIIQGAGHILVTRSGNTLTVTGNDTTIGTVTSVTAGAGLTQTGTSTVNPTILIDYTASGIIADATAMSGVVQTSDTLLLGDVSASGAVKRTTVGNIPLNVLGAPTTDLSINTHKLTNVVDPTAAQDAATKNYVDASVAGSGALIYQGGYNAATNTPNLDSVPTGTINKGFTYTVTVDGTFFSEQVRVGDLLIAESNTPTSLADWTTVQNNIDLASTTVVGIASFSPTNFAVSAAGEVTVKNGGIILGTETVGSYNPTVGTDTNVSTSGINVIDTLTLTDGVITTSSTRTLPTASTSSLGVIELATQAEVNAGTDALRAVTPATLKAHVDSNSFSARYPGSNNNTWTISAATHGLGTGPFLIQTFDFSTGNQIFMDVNVTIANGTITFNTTSAQVQDSVLCNIMKVR